MSLDSKQINTISNEKTSDLNTLIKILSIYFYI